MTTFKLAYKIEEGNSWEKGSIRIKSNLADDELIRCEIAKSLVEQLKKESVLLEPDKLVLAIAEAQKREIELNLENLDDMAIQAKVHADKAYQTIADIAEESEVKFLELEKKFSDTEKRFNKNMQTTAENIKNDMEKLSEVEEKLNNINNYSLEKLTEVLNQLIKLVEFDSELVKLVLNHKKS